MMRTYFGKRPNEGGQIRPLHFMFTLNGATLELEILEDVRDYVNGLQDVLAETFAMVDCLLM